MREGVDVYFAARALLNPIVAYGGSRSESFLDITGLEKASLASRMSPDSGVTIGLELDAN